MKKFLFALAAATGLLFATSPKSEAHGFGPGPRFAPGVGFHTGFHGGFHRGFAPGFGFRAFGATPYFGGYGVNPAFVNRSFGFRGYGFGPRFGFRAFGATPYFGGYGVNPAFDPFLAPYAGVGGCAPVTGGVGTTNFSFSSTLGY